MGDGGEVPGCCQDRVLCLLPSCYPCLHYKPPLQQGAGRGKKPMSRKGRRREKASSLLGQEAGEGLLGLSFHCHLSVFLDPRDTSCARAFN